MDQVLTRGNETATLVGRKKLAEVTGVRPSTLKYYSEIGLLPYKQVEEGLARRYDLQEAAQRLQEIKELQVSGLSIRGIQGRLCG